MPDSLPNNNNEFITISEASRALDVSIDTLRRWDKSGIIHPIRLDGKNRYFSIKEIERLKQNKPLSISEAAEKFGISISTLRRVEKKGLFLPQRNVRGERIYFQDALEKFFYSRDSRKNGKKTPLNLETLQELSNEEALQANASSEILKARFSDKVVSIMFLFVRFLSVRFFFVLNFISR